MADDPDEGYSDSKLAALAVETLQNMAERKESFFLAAGIYRPHLPWYALREYFDMYPSASITPPLVRCARGAIHRLFPAGS